MVTIILECNDETKARALASGFREQTVLVKCDPIKTSDENKRRLEQECFTIRPYRFLVSDTWGMGPG